MYILILYHILDDGFYQNNQYQINSKNKNDRSLITDEYEKNKIKQK